MLTCFSGSLVYPVTPSPSKDRCHAAASQMSDRDIDRSHTPAFICSLFFWKLQLIQLLVVSNLLSIPSPVLSWPALFSFIGSLFLSSMVFKSQRHCHCTYIHCHSFPQRLCSFLLHSSFGRLARGLMIYKTNAAMIDS